jgi:hypothetical protein
MDRRILLALLAALLIGSAGYFIITRDQGDYSRVIVITLHIGKEGVSPQSEQIRYGHPPVIGLINGKFRATFSDAEGRAVQDFGVHDPRVQFGDRIIGSEDEDGILSGFTVVSDKADMLLIVPYTGTEEKFILSDAATGRTLTSVDLTGAIAEFESTYPKDPGTVTKEAGKESPLTIPIALGGLVIVILFFAVLILMTRRE